MKKLFALMGVSLLTLSLAACGGGGEESDGPKTINLTYSGAASDQEFNESLFEKFKQYRKSLGDENTYNITYVAHGADKVDSEVLDWVVGPDVYEFASDKITVLYQKGALARLVGANADFVTENNSELGVSLATFNENLYAYPYTGDNTYYVQYDTSFYTAEDVKSIETMLEKAAAHDKYVGYNLGEAFWSAGALFTYGADYKMVFDEDGAITSISADFDGDAGQKAIKAMYQIMKSKAWQNEMAAPTPSNNLVACIAGTWDIAAYKEALGDNYGCAVMPTVTVDGDTKHLGAFLGGKLLGVNPQVSQGDNDRLVAAHELAKYLSNEESQLARFEENGIAPCNKAAATNSTVTSDPNVQVLIAQQEFAHAQTAVPGNFWTAPNTLYTAIADGSFTLEEIATYAKTLNDSIKASQ